jgi:flagellar basal-body rod protein FlgB
MTSGAARQGRRPGAGADWPQRGWKQPLRGWRSDGKGSVAGRCGLPAAVHRCPGTPVAWMILVRRIEERPMLSKLDRNLQFQQQALGLRALRQQVLAGNIANADTPNFKARDLDFATALESALGGRAVGSLPLKTTAPRHLAGDPNLGSLALLYRQPVQPSADGNTVEMDVEGAQLAANSIRYEAGLTFISGKIRGMMTALQGQ